MTNLKAFPGQIILKPYESTTPSGLPAPKGEKDPRFGIIHSFGEPVKDEHKGIKLKVGQKIIFAKYVSEALYVPEVNDNFFFIDYSDLYGELVEEEKNG